MQKPPAASPDFSHEILILMQEPKIPSPDLDFAEAALSPIMPHASAFKLLVTPITAIGIGQALP